VRVRKEERERERERGREERGGEEEEEEERREDGARLAARGFALVRRNSLGPRLVNDSSGYLATFESPSRARTLTRFARSASY